MKLELKHLAIAIANNQKVFYFDDERELNQVCEIVELRKEELTISNREYQYEVSLDEIKPILRPLSDLNKYENFELYMDLCEEIGVIRCDSLLDALEKENYYAIDIRKYRALEEWLNKNIFDWNFRLIEHNLAVDINTL